jgi:hypothetical protein
VAVGFGLMGVTACYCEKTPPQLSTDTHHQSIASDASDDRSARTFSGNELLPSHSDLNKTHCEEGTKPTSSELNKAQCDDDLEHEDDQESGYSESERFLQCLEYHRSLLYDYNRRWFPKVVPKDPEGGKIDEKTNDKEVNRSATWPRNVPSAKDIKSLETDLLFCQRSPYSKEQVRRCQDVQFRIAAYYVKQKDEESQRKGFKLVKELAEHGHPDGMCLMGKSKNKI